MQVGAMNDPSRDPLLEALEIARQGFDYMDFTHEPPKAYIQKSEIELIKAKIIQMGYTNFEIVGHTAFYLPIAVEFEQLFTASMEVFKSSILLVSKLGAKIMTVHYDSGYTVTDPKSRVKRHITMLRGLSAYIKRLGVNLQIVLENSPKGNGQVQEIEEILSAVPEIGLHLDIAHAWVTGGYKDIVSFIEMGKDGRLKHVHISENDGKSDQHYPLCTNFKNPMPWKKIISELKCIGYNKTITLEVFAPDRHYRQYSMSILRDLWRTV